ncbi:MAG: two-component system, OmpR family, sensor kinase [Chthoniobacter sp.]|jgi:heavy metal sensor kinase|nr:two-component system, OmpR family, sensor kinase [Chthoniobacter sp.]
MILRSIRWRLQLWHALLLAVVILGFGFTAHRLVTINRLRQVDQELQADIAQLGIAVPPTPGTDLSRRPPPRPGPSFTDQIIARGSYFAVWQSDGSVQVITRNAPAGVAKPAQVSTGESRSFRTIGTNREAIHFTGVGRCFLVGRSIEGELRELRQLAWYLGAAGGGVLALGLLGGWWMASRVIRPIAAISDTAEKIATGDLSQRIPTANSDDELGRLTSVLNSTFSRLDAAFTQQARFTADAAHELRTPVAAVLMHAQNGLASQPLNDEQRESFESCQRAAQRMRRLIDSLLELARLDAGQEAMKREPFDLAAIANDCLDLVQTFADARGIELRLQVDPTPCTGDAERIGQVITNLLTNAIEHTNSQITVRSYRENGSAVFTVSDNGPGIPPDHLPHLFKRFYRANRSRSDGGEHNGLGLAISKAIVEAHSGSLELQSRPGDGATFTMRLPTGLVH